MLSNEINLLEYLSRWEIEFGILDEDGETQVEVNVLNTDDTVTVRNMKIRDIMYFTEYGTITIPGKYILEKSLTTISEMVDNSLDQIVQEILEDKSSESSIESALKRLALNIQDRVRNYMLTFVTNNNKLGSIIHKDIDENRYLYNFEKLNKYIKCVARFKN